MISSADVYLPALSTTQAFGTSPFLVRHWNERHFLNIGMTVYYTLHFDCGNVFTATDDDFLLNFTIGGQGLSREGRLWKEFTETHLFGGKAKMPLRSSTAQGHGLRFYLLLITGDLDSLGYWIRKRHPDLTTVISARLPLSTDYLILYTGFRLHDDYFRLICRIWRCIYNCRRRWVRRRNQC
jgi:hypothetical protein